MNLGKSNRIYENRYTKKRVKEEKKLKKSLYSYFEKNNINEYNDLSVIGAFVTFNNLKKKCFIFN